MEGACNRITYSLAEESPPLMEAWSALNHMKGVLALEMPQEGTLQATARVTALANACFAIYNAYRQYSTDLVPTTRPLLFSKCLKVAKSILEAAVTETVDGTQMDAVSLVLLAYRQTVVALILALDSKDDYMLYQVKDRLGDFTRIPAGTTPEYRAVGAEARLLLSALDTRPGPLPLPCTLDMMDKEVVHARSRVVEMAMATGMLSDTRYLESVVDRMRLKIPVSNACITLRSAINAMASFPKAACTTVNYDRVVEIVYAVCTTVNYDRVVETVLKSSTRLPSDVGSDLSGVCALMDVVHLHGVTSGVTYPLTYRSYCSGHAQFLSTFVPPKRARPGHTSPCLLSGHSSDSTSDCMQSLVFVGCNGTLEDPHFLSLFDRLNSTTATQQHYVLGLDPSVDPSLRATVDRLRTRFPAINLTYIEYGREYGELGPFLLNQVFAAYESMTPPEEEEMESGCVMGGYELAQRLAVTLASHIRHDLAHVTRSELDTLRGVVMADTSDDIVTETILCILTERVPIPAGSDHKDLAAEIAQRLKGAEMGYRPRDKEGETRRFQHGVLKRLRDHLSCLGCEALAKAVTTHVNAFSEFAEDYA
ncbi:hypothetical protein KIPB_001045 [Kipferlia bialata]|uniref:Uncharacterized protein n=1 Tax=Kipferlia bialata TaxID=797122 RepID=A0A9K3CQ33_9EUKA|nr:hypothetical protein KIPB_001045 [Kipferlia bialata]|eukprot:g1045.t1